MALPFDAAGVQPCSPAPVPDAVEAASRSTAPSNVSPIAPGISARHVQPAAREPQQMPLTDEVAKARAKQRQERQAVELAVERRLEDLEQTDILRVPRMYVVITGSLASASALYLIARTSEEAFQRTGSPWVHADLRFWVHQAGVSEEDWVEARHLLRDLGLIKERRRFDLDRDQIISELAFELDAFSSAVARVRQELRSIAWDSMRTRGGPYLG